MATKTAPKKSPMQELIKYLRSIPAGRISDTGELAILLASCWDTFDGSDAESMKGSKLFGRMESVGWDPPILSFIIGRHGGFVLGSTREERHRWAVDVDLKSATYEHVGHKQLSPMQPRLNVEPIAKEIVQLILNHQQDKRLNWNQNGSVRVKIGEILPEASAVKQTLVARRKRFRKAVDDMLGNASWQKVQNNVYAPPGTQ